MKAKALLRGITWNHSRAAPPLLATAQRFEELHPGVEIRWDKRSLHDFGHASLTKLAARYDLLVIDHPMMGRCARSRSLLDLGQILEKSFLTGLASDTVGECYKSYEFEGKLFAVPIDAAAPAACLRPDRLERAGAGIPQTWSDLVRLARKGQVVMPGFPADVFLNFMGLCVSHGAVVAGDAEEFVDSQTGERCLDELRELAACMPEQIYAWNPIAIYEHLAAEDDHAYCPFAFSYSNYSRPGFAKRLVLFANPVRLDDGRPLRTVLGGAGIAISARCKTPDFALEYVTKIAGADWQPTLYGLAGGQPARRIAWQNDALNQITHGFFERTRDSIESAYLRPRYAGYVEFQAKVGAPLVQYLRKGGSPRQALEKVNRLYRLSQEGGSSRI
jgi:multiple sugar transport system substrate-binding protein